MRKQSLACNKSALPGRIAFGLLAVFTTFCEVSTFSKFISMDYGVSAAYESRK
jgi:hypothetical protein